MKTWDGFIVPLPFSTVSVRAGHCLRIPEEMDEAEFEKQRSNLENILKNGAD